MTGDHNHRHRHHRHLPKSEAPPAGGPVVLDIGGDVGALLAFVDDELVGHELHVRSAGRVGPTIHTGIWERSVGGRRVVVAVYPELRAGDYDVLDLAGSVWACVRVRPGEVAEIILDRGVEPT